MLTVNGIRPDIPIGDGRPSATATMPAGRTNNDRSRPKRKDDKRQALFKTKTGTTIGVCFGFNDLENLENNI